MGSPRRPSMFVHIGLALEFLLRMGVLPRLKQVR